MTGNGESSSGTTGSQVLVQPSGLGILPTIKRLVGRSNYNTWKFGMEMFLVAEELWTVVQGEETDPKKDSKAKSKICLMIDKSLYPIVRSCKSSEEVWKKLKNTYEDKDLSRRLSFLRRLFRIKLDGYSSMEEYLNEILSIVQKLDAIGAGIEDEFIGVIMLNGLGEEYDPMIIAMESSGAKITSDYVRTILIQQESRQSTQSVENVFLSTSKDKKSK